MTRYYVFIIVICSFNFKAQNKTIDSLITILNKAKQDTSKVLQLCYLCGECRAIGQYDNALAFGKQAYQLSGQLDFKRGLARSSSHIANVYYKQSNFPLALKSHFEALNIRKESNDRWGMAESYHNLGAVYEKMGDYPKALESYSTSLTLHLFLGDGENIIKTYSSMGIVYEKQGEYSKALECFSLSIAGISEKEREKSFLYSAAIMKKL